MAAKVITIFTPKGGVGKTTIALHMGWLMSKTAKVAMIDADERAMLKDTIGRGPENFPDIECYHFEDEGSDDDTAIREMIDEASYGKDVVIIDCGGYMSKSSYVAASMSDLVLIPITPDMKDLQQAHDSYGKLQLISKAMIDNGDISEPVKVRAVINNANTQTNAFALVKASLESAGMEMMKVAIPTYTAIRDASFQNSVVFLTRPYGPATTYMTRFVNECEKELEG